MKSIIFSPSKRESINELEYDFEVIDTLFEIKDFNKIFYTPHVNTTKKVCNFLKEKYSNYNFEIFNINFDNPENLFPPSRLLVTDYSKISIFYSIHTGNYSIFYIPGFKKDFYSLFSKEKMMVDLKEISFFATNRYMLKGMAERLLEYGDVEKYIDEFVKESIF